ncbi:hypothetical protein MA5_03970 [Rickettsia prowazekii str. GvV257]|nr:RecName: Full=Uncharacterized protein RP543 [Rickettsia prowazekii str. Madrid E]AFE49347.1 hypothetical protein M9W_02610 [Rickettsia prowazekii str. Chernikova]AFE50191.1 hypothetical protein M9Y_02615 [Rickettsia prowazekii str. Katsinyian]AFE51037.1 hypothetical protein MA1_02605 [Rickettsia prowazekii str. BuV67-CWPP]AFE51873.1 hypothetical protein MA3_02640 [Rickettsia prowazekii str. Dachau]AFE52968.1 hypothetical protein MA5_03970 [Rickettsia prowazekii str. GvV257]AMS12434.1 hypot
MFKTCQILNCFLRIFQIFFRSLPFLLAYKEKFKVGTETYVKMQVPDQRINVTYKNLLEKSILKFTMFQYV